MGIGWEHLEDLELAGLSLTRVVAKCSSHSGCPILTTLLGEECYGTSRTGLHRCPSTTDMLGTYLN